MNGGLLWILTSLAVCLSASAAAVGSAAQDKAGLPARLVQLETAVEAMPADAPDAVRARSMLRAVLRQARGHLDAGNADRAGELAGDIEAAVSRPAGREVFEQPFFLQFSRDPAVVNLFDTGVKEYIAAAEEPPPAPTLKQSSFKDVGAARRNGERAFAILVAVAHPESAHRGDPVLFDRLAARVAAYVESLAIARADRNMGEFFTLERNLFALYCFSKVYPDLLLPSQRRGLAEGLRFQAKGLEARFKKGDLYNWCNSDVSYASALIHGGLLIGESRFVEIGKAVIAKHVSEQFPDGGFQYVRGQNECLGYHAIMPRTFNNLWLTTRDETALQGIVRSRNYTLLTTEPVIVGGFYMSPAWKWGWNTSYPTPLETAYHTRDPWLKTYQLVRLSYAAHARRRGDFNPMSVMLDLSSVEARPLPDHYTVYDANLQGPRARHGRFAYAATGRVVNSPVGLQTLVGGMVVDDFDPKRPLPLNAALGGVFAGPTVGTSGRFSDHATLTDRIEPTVMIGHGLAGLTARYKLSAQDFGPKEIATSWGGHQQWVLLPDRLVGLVTVNPGREPASEVAGRIKLLAGGTGITYPKQIQSTSDRDYTFGDLRVRIHDHNYGRIDVQEKTFTAREGRDTATDIRLLDPASLAAPGSGQRKYDEPFHFLVEVRPAMATEEAVVERLTLSGLHGLRVRLRGRQLATVMNASNAPVTVPASQLIDASDLHLLRPFRYQADNTPRAVTASTPITLAPGEGATLLAGGADDARAPWSSFDDMLRAFEQGNPDETGLRPYPLPGLTDR